MAVKQAEQHFKLALEAGAMTVDNTDPVKLHLVLRLCEYQIFIKDDKAMAINLASDFMGLIPAEDMDKAQVLSSQIQRW